MARDRQWVVLDQSQNPSKHRESSVRDIEEGKGRDKGADRPSDTPSLPDSYGPGE